MTRESSSIDQIAGFKTLSEAYENPASLLIQKAGGLVGRLSPTVPVEPILAVGRAPVLLKPPVHKPTPTADIYIDPILPPRTRAFFQAAVDGEYENLDLLILGRGDDKLYYYLKEIYRLGRAPKLPPLFAFDLMMNRSETVRSYNQAQFDGLCEALERSSGVTLTDSALAEAADAAEGVRVLQRRLDVARIQGRISGTDAMVAIGAGYFMVPGDYAVALSDFVAAIEVREPLERRPRVLVLSAEPLSFLDLHRRIEAAGALVIGEDDAWGARAHGDDIGDAGDVRSTLFERAWRGVADASVMPDEARDAWALERVEWTDIDAVVFYAPPSDRQFGWEYPRLSKTFEALGLRTLLLRDEARDPANGLDRQVADFLAEGAR